jgi:hypothetical protein
MKYVYRHTLQHVCLVIDVWEYLVRANFEVTHRNQEAIDAHSDTDYESFGREGDSEDGQNQNDEHRAIPLPEKPYLSRRHLGLGR